MSIVLALGVLAAVSGAGPLMSMAPPDDAAVREALQKLSRRTLFFGHQSVGANVLEGVARVAAANGGGLRVVEVTAPGAPFAAGALSHALVGSNGDPLSKLTGFAGLLAESPAPPELAFVKLCWADFGPGTDAAALFRAYRERLASLAGLHPKTTFVHVTVPLTTVQSGPKAFLKRLLRRAPYGAAENEAREAYNALLRQAYAGREPLFDLARLESTAPDGAAVTHEEHGQRTPMLFSGYTGDGGHLNAAGQDRVARALLVYLAGLP